MVMDNTQIYRIKTRRNPIQRDEYAYEIMLFADGDKDLYRERTRPIILNLAKKMVKGNYNHELALKIWQPWANDAAKRYDADFGTGYAPLETRKELARLAREQFLEDIEYEANELKLAKTRVKKNPVKKATTKKRTVKKKEYRIYLKTGNANWRLAAVAYFKKDATGLAKALAKYNPRASIKVDYE